MIEINMSNFTASSTPIGSFQVMSNGSVIVGHGYSGVGYIALNGDSDKSFRINYTAKNGEFKTETIKAPTLESATSKIQDLDRVNYHIED